jgi:hypothetical protein
VCQDMDVRIFPVDELPIHPDLVDRLNRHSAPPPLG